MVGLLFGFGFYKTVLLRDSWHTLNSTHLRYTISKFYIVYIPRKPSPQSNDWTCPPPANDSNCRVVISPSLLQEYPLTTNGYPNSKPGNSQHGFGCWVRLSANTCHTIRTFLYSHLGRYIKPLWIRLLKYSPLTLHNPLNTLIPQLWSCQGFSQGTKPNTAA